MKYLFSFLLFVHGLIHLMGFANGFGFSKLPALTKYISKLTGTLWLFAAMLFTATVIFYILKKENWPLFAVAAVVLSQLLVVWYWKDAKMGTAANFIILLVVIPALGEWQFNRMYKKECSGCFHNQSTNQQGQLQMNRFGYYQQRFKNGYKPAA